MVPLDLIQQSQRPRSRTLAPFVDSVPSAKAAKSLYLYTPGGERIWSALGCNLSWLGAWPDAWPAAATLEQESTCLMSFRSGGTVPASCRLLRSQLCLSLTSIGILGFGCDLSVAPCLKVLWAI